MKKLSLVMITKNEENNIRRCLNSVKDIVNEIISVDTGSTDKTKDIALEFNAKVYDYEWDDNFSNARNYGIKKSSGDWNLILDADDFVFDINLNELHEFMNSNENIIGQIEIYDLFEDNNEIRKSKSFTSRLAPKNVLFYGAIHEQLDTTLPRKLVCIKVEHDGYLKVNKLNKFNRNIKLILNELKNNEEDVYLLYQAAKTYYSNKMYKDASSYFESFYCKSNFNTDAFFKDGIILYLYNSIKNNEFDKGLKIINDNFDILSSFCDFYFVCGVFFTELVAYDSNKYIGYFDNIRLCYLNALQLGEDNNDCVEGTGSYFAAFNLGIYFELIGNNIEALKYYNLSYDYGYYPALDRIKLLTT